jgi:large subunit ribosomal protein L18
MDIAKKRKIQRKHIHKRIRSKISGSSDKPRISVFRSNKHMYVQVIDDEKQITLLSISDHNIKDIKKKTDIASMLGTMLSEKMKAKNITKAVFDRGGYQYHGRVQALADSLRKNGIIF